MDASATGGFTVIDAVGASGVGVVFGIEIAVGEGAVAGVSSSTHPANTITTTAAIVAMAIMSLPRGSYRFMQCSQPHNDI